MNGRPAANMYAPASRPFFRVGGHETNSQSNTTKAMIVPNASAPTSSAAKKTSDPDFSMFLTVVVLRRGLSSWRRAYRLSGKPRAKSLQRSASNFQSLQNPASGSQDSLNSSLRKNQRRSSPFLRASQSALATNGFAESLIRPRASLSGCFTAIMAGAFSNISCAAAQRFGGSMSVKLVSVPAHTKRESVKSKAN